MDDVVDLIDRFANRGHPRGAQRVLDDARSGTVVLRRGAPAPEPRQRRRVAIAVLAGIAIVGAGFLAVRNDSSQPDPADRGTVTVLDNVSDADAADLCQRLKPLAAEADRSRQNFTPQVTVTSGQQYLALATQARILGATAFAAALIESGEQLIHLAQRTLDARKSGEELSMADFRLAILRLNRADAELELACAARGHDLVFGPQTNDSDTPVTTASR